MPQDASISLPKGTNIPNHVVIIPDGDRRWARARGVSPSEGHKAGIENMIKLAKTARLWGIHTVSSWGLSTENWLERPKDEVDFLMKGIYKALDIYCEEMQKDGVRLVHLGRKDRLPDFLLKKIAEVEKSTKNNTKHVFNVGLDYNGWDEIVRATQKIIESGISSDKVDRKLIDANMDTSDQPYPYIDLYIRTSGEQRTSGFMMWQADYAEFYWEPDYFPAFTPEKLKLAILDYSRRRRRFGGNDAVEHFSFKPELAARLELNWWRLKNIPHGTKFRDYAIAHVKEQFGLSKDLAKEAGILMSHAVIEGNARKWEKAKIPLKKFYQLIKDEIKLAFEPSLVASLQVNFWKEINGTEDIRSSGEAEDIAKNLYAEVYRISLFQAAKVAHLCVLANVERNLAERGYGEEHWKSAENYLQKFYSALKERIA